MYNVTQTWRTCRSVVASQIDLQWINTLSLNPYPLLHWLVTLLKTKIVVFVVIDMLFLQKFVSYTCSCHNVHIVFFSSSHLGNGKV